MKKYNVTEIFYSIQGEGFNSGTPMIFVRLAGCSYGLCTWCDTDYRKKEELTAREIFSRIKEWPHCKNILITGGEPMDQVDDGFIDTIGADGNLLFLETSGTKPVPENYFNYITVSPKAGAPNEVLEKNLPADGVDELRYPMKYGRPIPEPTVRASYKYLSPIKEMIPYNNSDMDNLDWCVELVKNNPGWILSTQSHRGGNWR